ncbi:hypothetical protein D1B31_04175 [Neobacillus notoginsengisoli]|uniref:Outer membrane protein assembly factor BamE n=1 Tax=Neobacillus notoginsengisoli TaxID=1578198 RepID=A0A417YYV3_9BACI|nr:hypothetical protein [Neobacillus notoginsengisoli]RHW42783.1 hypothetical protein D1B31_04175 [Neobacillus notoginsengisoli]
MGKTIKVVMLTLLSIGLFAGGVLFLLHLLFSPDQFNRDRWLNEPGERVEMVDSLLSEVRLKGMSKAEIIDLLGEQGEEAYLESDNLVYYLGDERGFISIDSEWLIIRFDNHDRVTDYEIKTD